jgi:hypothetical protein
LWLLTRGPAGAVESVQYHGLIPMLLNEPQRQEGPETSIGRTVDAAGRGCPPFRLVGKSLSMSLSRRQSAVSSAHSPAVARFVDDAPLERNGVEPSVPRKISYDFEVSARS